VLFWIEGWSAGDFPTVGKIMAAKNMTANLGERSAPTRQGVDSPVRSDRGSDMLSIPCFDV
jgi:hypothetical protein